MSKKETVYPYIPNSVPEVQREMLREIGARDVDEFFACIPEPLRFKEELAVPEALLSEAELKRHVERVLARNRSTSENISFLGGGCWNHHVLAVCDEINQRFGGG